MKAETVLYETDAQKDFMDRRGALFIRNNQEPTPWPYGAELILPNMYELHKYALGQKWRIAGSCDRHFEEDVELKRNNGAFIDHCMNGTWGQLRLEGLWPQRDIYIRSKDGPMLGQRIYTEDELRLYAETNRQLIFEKQSYDVATNPNFKHTMRLLFDRGMKRLVFDGVATDYCVKAAVLASAKFRDQFGVDLELYVVKDAIEAVGIDFEGKVNPGFTQQALDEMQKVGTKFVTTADVLEGRI